MIGTRPPHNCGAAAPCELQGTQPRHNRAARCSSPASRMLRSCHCTPRQHAVREHVASRAVFEASRSHLNNVQEVVVGTQEQPPTGPPRHEARPAAAAIEVLAALTTVKLRPLQNDVLEIRPVQTRPQLHIVSCNEHLSTAASRALEDSSSLPRAPTRA